MTTRLFEGLLMSAGLMALLVALFLLSVGCIGKENGDTVPGRETTVTNISRTAQVESQRQDSDVIHVENETEFRKHVLEADLPCLADFFSDFCPPCRMLAPSMEALAVRYKGKAAVCKVSLDFAETQALARQYGIVGIPSVLFFVKGKETQRLVGLRPEEEYAHVLDGMVEPSSE